MKKHKGSNLVVNGLVRKIRPNLFKDDVLGSCSADARIFFIGMLVFSTRKLGFLVDDANKLSAQIFPCNPNINVELLLIELHSFGLINRLEMDGLNLIQILDLNQWCEIKPDSKDHSHAANRRALKRNACPAWANKTLIKEIYKTAKLRIAAGEDVHVDHIIPLAGKDVCGLHVHLNLQIITSDQNLKKSNKFKVD